MIHRACRPKSWCRSDVPLAVNALLRPLLSSLSIRCRRNQHQQHQHRRRRCPWKATRSLNGAVRRRTQRCRCAATLVHPGCNDDTLRNARQERFDFLGYSFGPHRYKANGYYDLPVVETLRQCTNTETGWRAVDGRFLTPIELDLDGRMSDQGSTARDFARPRATVSELSVDAGASALRSRRAYPATLWEVPAPGREGSAFSSLSSAAELARAPIRRDAIPWSTDSRQRPIVIR
jgi:hypothetical protein